MRSRVGSFGGTTRRAIVHRWAPASALREIHSGKSRVAKPGRPRNFEGHVPKARASDPRRPRVAGLAPSFGPAFGDGGWPGCDRRFRPSSRSPGAVRSAPKSECKRSRGEDGRAAHLDPTDRSIDAAALHGGGIGCSSLATRFASPGSRVELGHPAHRPTWNSARSTWPCSRARATSARRRCSRAYEAATGRLRAAPSITPSAYTRRLRRRRGGRRYRKRFEAVCRLAKVQTVAVVTIPAAPIGTPFDDEVKRLAGAGRLRQPRGAGAGPDDRLQDPHL